MKYCLGVKSVFLVLKLDNNSFDILGFLGRLNEIKWKGFSIVFLIFIIC